MGQSTFLPSEASMTMPVLERRLHFLVNGPHAVLRYTVRRRPGGCGQAGNEDQGGEQAGVLSHWAITVARTVIVPVCDDSEGLRLRRQSWLEHSAGSAPTPSTTVKGSATSRPIRCACKNCHVMNDQYASWSRGPHHAVGAVRRLSPAARVHPEVHRQGRQRLPALQGFTFMDFHEPIMITPRNARTFRRTACAVTPTSCTTS